MSLLTVFDIAGSGMSAQSNRLNTVASNIANAEVISGSDKDAYRAKQVVFQTVLAKEGKKSGEVAIKEIVESNAPITKAFMPESPLADKDGYIYRSNVNTVEEMANMISTSRSYQTNVEIMKASKQMIVKTLSIGQL